MMAVHFVGFRTDAEHSAAVKVWGKPDFVHLWNDHRMQGDIDDDLDTVVFGSKGSLTPSKFSWQDHELW